VSPRSHRVTLDVSAVLAWVLHERGFETIDRVLPIAVVPVSAMVEVMYRAVERGHRLSPAQLHADLLALGLSVESVTDADAERAAADKGEGDGAGAIRRSPRVLPAAGPAAQRLIGWAAVVWWTSYSPGATAGWPVGARWEAHARDGDKGWQPADQ
jgi:hypothetical protein